MSITKEIKQELVVKYAQHKIDTGSPEIQCAIFTRTIEELSRHLQTNKKDKQSERGLLQLVQKRRRLLKYLKSKDVKRYEVLIASLNLRK